MGAGCRCVLCGSSLSYATSNVGICDVCLEEMVAETRYVCRICGLPLPRTHGVCRDCMTRAHWFDMVRTAGLYRGKLKDAIVRMKYRGERSLKRPLGRLLAAIALELPPFDVVVPVPVDPLRRQIRGFDQARDLAEEIAWAFEVDLLCALKREKADSAIAGLPGRDRRQEVKKVIQLARPFEAGRLSGLRVLLVDDVVTTGATVDASSRILKTAGASRVYVAALARTPA